MSGGRREGRGGGRGAGRAPPKVAPFLLGLPEDGDSDDDVGLEAELMAITGGNKAANKQQPKGKTPLPMEHIERMAALCMKDIDEGDVDDEDVDDEDLMAELDEVLGEEKEEPQIVSPPTKSTPSSAGGIEGTLTERLAMYKEALVNAKQSGEGTKARRYERGVKTLEDLLRTAKRGGSVSPDDIPPAVAVGKSTSSPATSPTAAVVPDLPVKPAPPANGIPPQPPVSARAPPPVPVKPQSLPQPVTLSVPAKSSAPITPITPLTPNSTLATSSTPVSPSPVIDGNKARVLERQRQYKLAALKSKQEGDAELASKYYRIAKSLDPMLSALDSGQPVNLNSLPPPPPADEQPSSKPSVPQSPVSTESPVSATPPAPPKDLLEALQQRMEKYRSAAEQAKGKGDDRKARMHERIVKQYQDAIRSHKAGKPVNVAELPVPPGFPPIEGSNAAPADQSLVGVLETAMRLANQQEGDGDDDDDDEEDEEGNSTSNVGYDPADFEHLPVTSDIKELFQYITRYTPHTIDLDHRLKPFIPDFIPAVGDIDAFLKVPRPDSKPDNLGLLTLDEPSTKQSDSTVMALWLTEGSKQHSVSQQIKVKSLDNAERNHKAIDSWIASISELHHSKPPASVHYTRPMPEVETLMQEWLPEFEELLGKVSLPSADLDCDLPTYIDMICGIVDIPVYKSRIQSLHVLFSLYSEFKNSQHFKALVEGKKERNSSGNSATTSKDNDSTPYN